MKVKVKVKIKVKMEMKMKMNVLFWIRSDFYIVSLPTAADHDGSLCCG